VLLKMINQVSSFKRRWLLGKQTNPLSRCIAGENHGDQPKMPLKSGRYRNRRSAPRRERNPKPLMFRGKRLLLLQLIDRYNSKRSHFASVQAHTLGVCASWVLSCFSHFFVASGLLMYLLLFLYSFSFFLLVVLDQYRTNYITLRLA